MLPFLRKNQRFFLIVITSVIVVSFVFFGTFTNIVESRQGEDKVIAKAIDGRSVKQSEIENMIRFLSNSVFSSAEKNLLNDGVIEKDFLETGLGNILTDSYFDALEPSLSIIHQKTKDYHHYVHPTAPFLQEELVWQNYSPNLYADLQVIRGKPFSKDTFALLSRLLLAESEFPADRVKRVLMHQQNQYSWLTPDPNLANQRLGLFGFTSLQDWFGTGWMQLASELIINAAIDAEKKGHVVSYQEAKMDLVKNFYEGVKRIEAGAQIELADAFRYFPQACNHIGLDEKSAVEVWKKVLLFRRLQEDVTANLQIDPFVYQSFAEYSQAKVSIESYHLPKELQFNSFRKLLKWETYLDATAKRPSLLEMPNSTLSVEEVEKKYPELVEMNFEIEVASINISKFFPRINLKELWDFQVAEENWQKISAQFPEISSKESATSESRFASLETLNADLRSKIDRFCLEQIVSMHTDWIKDDLNSAPSAKQHLSIRMQNHSSELAGITSPDDLRKLLEQAPLKDQNELGIEDIKIQDELAFFTQDGQNFHRIAVLAKNGKKVLSFDVALKDNTLDQLLDRNLEQHYATWIRKGNLKSEDVKKPFQEVKDQVGASYYKPLLDAIQNAYAANTGEKVIEPTFDFYTKNRFHSYLHQIKSELEKSAQSSWIAKENQLNLPWQVQVTLEETERSDDASVQKDVVFSLVKDQWSSLYQDSEKGLTFCQLKEILINNKESYEKIEEGRDLLGKEAKKFLMQQFLEKLQKKGALVIYNQEPL